jgi:hypothetical protein
VTNAQLYLAIGVPIVFNTLVTVTLFLGLTARITSLNQRMDDGFAAINQRFDDMRDLWRAELRRVEEVMDARLKALEEHRP